MHPYFPTIMPSCFPKIEDICFVASIHKVSIFIHKRVKRVIDLLKKKGFSKSELPKIVGISYAQPGRYETKGARPPAEVLKKLADALDTTVDFLINGNTDEKATSTLKDAELCFNNSGP